MWNQADAVITADGRDETRDCRVSKSIHEVLRPRRRIAATQSRDASVCGISTTLTADVSSN